MKLPGFADLKFDLGPPTARLLVLVGAVARDGRAFLTEEGHGRGQNQREVLRSIEDRGLATVADLGGRSREIELTYAGRACVLWIEALWARDHLCPECRCDRRAATVAGWLCDDCGDISEW